MGSGSIGLSLGVLLASRSANAACVISGARPTVPLPTMEIGQEFSFIASPDCETLRFTIRGTTVSKMPKSGGPVGPGPRTYKVHLTEREWDAVVAKSGSTLTWIVTGRTSAGVMTRLVTTNDLKGDETITIDLSMADAKLVGENLGDQAGYSVSGAGDVDSDGHDDLLVSAIYNYNRRSGAGAAYLVLGPVTGTLDLSRADAKLVGAAVDDLAGWNVSGARDMNDDGHDDLLVGAPFSSEGGSDAGAAFLVLGPVTGRFNLALADAKLVGAEQQWAGFSVSDAGDVNGNDHEYLLVGAPGPIRHAGAAFLVQGPVTGTLNISSASATLLGEADGDQAGWSVSGAGDVDGDGDDDVLVGVGEYGSTGAAGYLVLGSVSGTLDLSLADAKLVAESSRDGAGTSVSGAGDVNGDGNDDLLIGAPYISGFDGAAYLVLGPVTGTFNLALADAKFLGEESVDNDNAGRSVSGAGDVDGDRNDDVLVGADRNAEAGSRAGAAYLVLGPVSGTSELALANIKLVGEQGAWAGGSVSGAGDVDGDGHDDLLIGARNYEQTAAGGSVGAAYVVYGGGLF